MQDHFCQQPAKGQRRRVVMFSVGAGCGVVGATGLGPIRHLKK